MTTSSQHHSLLYQVYMGSPLWRFRRWCWYHTSNKRCEDCGRRLVLHTYSRRPAELLVVFGRVDVMTVHHRHYRTLGHERRSDVQLLCWTCHRRRDSWRQRGR